MNEDIYIETVRDQIAKGMYDHLFIGKHDLVFLDIGANIGQVSWFASPFCKRIVSLEPDPETYMELKRSGFGIMDCYELALAPKDGPCDFYQNDINFTASSTVNTYGKQITVEGITLTSILEHLRLGHVDVCKIDCEGCEGESLGFDQLNACKHVIKTFYIETHNCPKTTWEHKLGTIVGNLARCGYTKMSVDGMAVTATRP